MPTGAQLRHFFSDERWRQSIDRFPKSGLALIERVNALNPGVVVDAGCGFNPFKGRIRNLIGIDIANRHADLVCDIEAGPFAPGSVDAGLALGSINFGGETRIVAQLAAVARWLRPGGVLFMRVNPGEPIGAEFAVFPWSETLVEPLGGKAGLQVDGRVEEERLVLSNGVPARRLFWIYRKPL